MAITLWNVFEANLLCLNAVCILHEERFLVKIGWSAKSPSVDALGENPSTKAQLLNLIHSIRTVARGVLMHILAVEPNLIQDVCSEVMQQLINDYLKPKQSVYVEQLVCPIVITPPAMILEEYPSTGLCYIRGILFEHSAKQKFIRRSNWRCTEACCEANRAIMVKGDPKLTPLCRSCAAPLKEISNGRDLGSYIVGNIVSTSAFSNCSNAVIKSISFRIDDARIKCKMQLGNEYVLTGVRKGSYFDVWGCTIYDRVCIGRVQSKSLELLRLRRQNDPWAFVQILSNILGSTLFPLGSFELLRTGLLLSLASTKSSRPVHILATYRDSDSAKKLMLRASSLTSRCVKCNPSSTKIGVTYNEKTKAYAGDALTLASGGVCYLGNWEAYNGKRGFPVRESVQYGKIPVENADGEYVPLRCAVWSVTEQINKRRSTEQLKTLMQVFGLAWTSECLDEQDETYVDFLLDGNNHYGHLEVEDELKNYIDNIINIKVRLTEDAILLLQRYFACARKIRGDSLPLTSLEPLTSLAEAHARLNQRIWALREDVLKAIYLCEFSLKPCLALPLPPKEMNDFERWLIENVLYSNIQYP